MAAPPSIMVGEADQGQGWPQASPPQAPPSGHFTGCSGHHSKQYFRSLWGSGRWLFVYIDDQVFFEMNDFIIYLG